MNAKTYMFGTAAMQTVPPVYPAETIPLVATACGMAACLNCGVDTETLAATWEVCAGTVALATVVVLNIKAKTRSIPVEATNSDLTLLAEICRAFMATSYFQ